MIVAPVTYQGAKGRLADDIVRVMKPDHSKRFYDLCCGSGAVSVALVNSGFPASKITMVDSGPWGAFWRAMGDGSFSLERFAARVALVPKDPRLIKDYLVGLHRQKPKVDDFVYDFLLLQAGSFGAKPIGGSPDLGWSAATFRSLWEPTATSNRRSHVNPMMPMPDTIMDRVSKIVPAMKGVCGIHGPAQFAHIEFDSTVYIDPPYHGTAGYGDSIDVLDVAEKLRAAGVACWVSEGERLSDSFIKLSEGRKKGGISGNRKTANQEWLSYFGPPL